VKLATHLLLLRKSRMRGAISPHPIRLHGIVLSYAEGQLYILYKEKRNIFIAAAMATVKG